MTIKTSKKVAPTVKQFTPKTLILHEMLRPGYHASEEMLVQLCVDTLGLDKRKAVKVVSEVCDYVYDNNITWHDRDKFNLPNISDRYPRYKEVCKHWKSKVKDFD